jgi:apolipoprotein D and lipocalin family protein
VTISSKIAIRIGRRAIGGHRRLFAALLACLAVLAACAHGGAPKAPLRTVPAVDLDRYLGTWYEIASYPQWFQRNCAATTATYSRREDGRIRVVNACRDGGLDGTVRQAEAVAWVVKGEPSNAKLRVQFFWLFRGDYWIIELDEEYRYAVVGHPSREYLWILARTPQIDPALHADLVRRIEAHGYDANRLQRTLQPAER